MPPLDGTFLQAHREWVIAFCLARGRPQVGEKASLILATDACMVHFERVGSQGAGTQRRESLCYANRKRYKVMVMKFTINPICSCGRKLTSTAYGDGDFESVVCPDCNMTYHQVEPLSVSPAAERLLLRSNAELEAGDYSLAVVIGAMAVEAFLTSFFMKLKGMDNYALTWSLATPLEEAAWEKEYPRSGGFPKPADFVSNKIAGVPFDEFVVTNQTAKAIMDSLPEAVGQSAKDFFQVNLFYPRNRIAHWGYVNTTEAEGQRCHELAVAIVSIFREMDRAKYFDTK
jgi:hypothetical protein